MDMQQTFDQWNFSHFTAQYSSASLVNFTIASNVTTESESKSLANKHHQQTCTSSEGKTSCDNSMGANADKITHVTSKGEALNTP